MPNEFKIKNGLLVDQGPTVLSGSLTVSGSTTLLGSLSTTQGMTGSLSGTASFAISSSWAPTFIQEKEHDFITPYSYCGTAPQGTLISQSFWDISRIEVAPDGSVTTTSAIDVAWTDRETVIYT